MDEGKEFRFPWGRGKGVMHNTMVRPKPNVLFFSAWEPVKLWNLTSEMVFTKYGMINTRRFVNENVTAKKYYQVNQLVTQLFWPFKQFPTENSSTYQENLKQKSVLMKSYNIPFLFDCRGAEWRSTPVTLTALPWSPTKT